MAPPSSTLAWKIPWTEEPGRLQSMGSLRVKHNWATSLSLFTFMHRRRKWQPTPVFLTGESQGRQSLGGCRLWVAQSRTRLKWLSSSSIPLYLPVCVCVCVCVCVNIYAYIHHIFFIHSSFDGHLGCSHVLAIVNSATVNIGVHVSLWQMCHVCCGQIMIIQASKCAVQSNREVLWWKIMVNQEVLTWGSQAFLMHWQPSRVWKETGE